MDLPTAEMFFAGDGHSHWHLRDLAVYELTRLDNGVKVGTGAKTGFCFYDNVRYRLSLPSAPQTAVYRNCGDANSLTVTPGLSVGWGDLYPYTIAFQYVDITGLTAGRYRLTVSINVEQLGLTETNASNNATWVDLQIKGKGRDLQIVGYGPSA